MHIVIMGCGRAGARLARKLDEEGHSVAVIDRNPTAFHLLGLEFKGATVTGVGFDPNALIEAGVERADSFVAVSSGDNSNIVSSIVAKDVFHVPRVITRIYDPRRAQIYRRMGIPTVAPVTWGVNRIMDLLFLETSYTRDTFGNGEVELMEARVPETLVGRTTGEFEVPGEIHIASIERLGSAFMPVSGTKLERDDVISVMVLRESIGKFKRMFFGA
ncbi:MAG: TrkA family potassium uptake protein [Candidatus Anoxymicrobium japonicum]|uniref:Trk system potassium uptake protein TrkA n=1 Tax=Candidatus Anoxymicrobium japonicum TaxID=2013648 RepID=A0A2N3G6C1_9ACTN|nr:MAG: TrkA family potassium uptake protein [Candidatus Anoxymicrobium japonicum]